MTLWSYVLLLLGCTSRVRPCWHLDPQRRGTRVDIIDQSWLMKLQGGADDARFRVIAP